MEYIKALIFFVLFTIFIYVVGSAFSLKKRSVPFRFMIGYILYSVLLAIGGIPIQELGMSWTSFKIWMVLVIVILLVFTVYRIIRRKCPLFPDGIVNFIVNNWFIIIILFVMTLFAMANISFMISDNCADDGYYLVRIATLPYQDNPFWVIPGTGLARRIFTFSTYNLNTFEAEAAFYSSSFGIDPTVYTRFGLAGFNILLYISSISAVVSLIIESVDNEKIKSISQYVPAIIVLFVSFGFKIFDLQDSWQFSSAMYYGSTLVRTSGVFMLMLPFISDDKIKVRNIFLLIAICIVLVSKSTVCLPVIILMVIGGVFVKLLSMDNRYKIAAVIFLIIALLICYFVPGNDLFYKDVISRAESNMDLQLTLYALVIVVVGTIVAFLLKVKRLYMVNIMVLLFYCLLVVKPIANLAEAVSFYDFVEKRALTAAVYAVVVLAMINIAIFVVKYLNRKIFVNIFGCTFASFVLILYLISNSSDLSAASDYRSKNPSLYPQVTKELGESLEKLYDEEDKVMNAMCQYSVKIEGYDHFVGLTLRTYTPHTNNVTAIGRFGNVKGNAFSTFKFDDYLIFNAFTLEQNEDTFNNLKALLENYPINILILDKDQSEWLNSIGYASYSTITSEDYDFSYYVYYNKDVDTEKEIPIDYGEDSETGEESTITTLSGLANSGSYLSGENQIFFESYYTNDEALNRNYELSLDPNNVLLPINEETFNGSIVYTVSYYIAQSSVEITPEVDSDNTDNMLTGLYDSGTYVEGENTINYESYYTLEEAMGKYNVLISDSTLVVSNILTETDLTGENTVYKVTWYKKEEAVDTEE